MRTHRPDSGIVLLQVLVIIAIASAAVMLMLSSDELAIQRSLSLREAATAAAAARGGERSAIVALRRDGVTAPEADHLGEAWAKIGERDVAIEGGRFSLSIDDAQARFNLNNMVLDPDRLAPVFRRLTEAAKVTPVTGDLLIAYLGQTGPAAELSSLSAAGVDPESLGRLSELATVLPTSTMVNLNTASEPLLGVMFGDPVIAALLVTRRTRAGFLTSADVQEVGAAMPPGAGFTSNFYFIASEALIGETRQGFHTLLGRRIANGKVEIAPLARRQ